MQRWRKLRVFAVGMTCLLTAAALPTLAALAYWRGWNSPENPLGLHDQPALLRLALVAAVLTPWWVMLLSWMCHERKNQPQTQPIMSA